MIVGQEVSLGDRVRTDKTAVAIVKFPDVGQFVIGPSSGNRDGQRYERLPNENGQGALWLKADLPKGGRASVSTSLATAGVRGTAFSVIFSEDGGCVCTCSGKVEVAMKSGQTIDVSKGKYIPIISDEPTLKRHSRQPPMLGREKDTRSNTDFNRCFNRKKRYCSNGLPEGKEGHGLRRNFCFSCHIRRREGQIKNKTGSNIFYWHSFIVFCASLAIREEAPRVI